MHAPDTQEEFKPPDTLPSGSRGGPPRWPPAPPGSGEAGPPSGGSPYDRWPFRGSMSWGRGEAPGLRTPNRIPWLAEPLELSVREIDILHTVLSAVSATRAADPEAAALLETAELLDADNTIELLFREARERLLERLNDLKAHLRDTPPVDDLYAFKAGVLAWAARPQETRLLQAVVRCAGDATYDPPHPEWGESLPPTFRYTFHSGPPMAEAACLKPMAFIDAVLDDLIAALSALNGASHPMDFAVHICRKYAVLLLAAGSVGATSGAPTPAEAPTLSPRATPLPSDAEESLAEVFEGFTSVVSMMGSLILSLGALEGLPKHDGPSADKSRVVTAEPASESKEQPAENPLAALEGRQENSGLVSPELGAVDSPSAAPEGRQEHSPLAAPEGRQEDSRFGAQEGRREDSRGCEPPDPAPAQKSPEGATEQPALKNTNPPGISDEQAVAEELHRALGSLRKYLAEQLNHLERRVSQPAKGGFLESDLRRFRTAMLVLLGWGVEHEKLETSGSESATDLTVECEAEKGAQQAERYLYRMRNGVTFLQVFGMAPWVVARWAIADLRAEVLDDRSFAGTAAFEEGIYRKFLAWRLAARGDLLEPAEASPTAPTEQDTDASGE